MLIAGLGEGMWGRNWLLYFCWVSFGLGMHFQDILPFSAEQFIRVFPPALKVWWLKEIVKAYFCSFVTTVMIYHRQRQSHLHCTFATYNNNLSPREKVRVKCFFIDYLPWAKHHSQECSSLRAADCSCIGCELQKRTKVRTEWVPKTMLDCLYQSTCSGMECQSRKWGIYC